MTPDELRLKHSPLELSQGKIDPIAYCKGCAGPGGTMTIKWPCDLIQFLNDIRFEEAMRRVEDITIELDLPR